MKKPHPSQKPRTGRPGPGGRPPSSRGGGGGGGGDRQDMRNEGRGERKGRSQERMDNKRPPSAPKPAGDRGDQRSTGPRSDWAPRAPWQRQPPAKPLPKGPPIPIPGVASTLAQKGLPKALLPDLCVYGRHACEATLKFQPQRVELMFHTDHRDLVPLVELAHKNAIKTRLVDHATTDALAGGRDVAVAQGVVLQCTPFPFADIEDFQKVPQLTLVLDGVEDPRNFGAAVRAAYALGAGLVVIPGDRAATATASAIKASAGALCRIPVAQAINLRRALEQLKEKGAWVVGAEADGDKAPWELDLTGPTVLVIGGEDRGLRRLTREACDHITAIPMPAGDMSLNAADAATLLLYEAQRQKRTGPGGAPKPKKEPAPEAPATTTAATSAKAKPAKKAAAKTAARPATTTTTAKKPAPATKKATTAKKKAPKKPA